ncbi:CRISPR-associated helicase/endonuclease Cas3 [Gallaecimonas xiamenensis]|uniref:CRISPR-associated helicase Cas3 n=1 Tax=Gallaecimonas xiamenensis 3-C-1 TaxID=745411 RepID=K2JML8_9GAMM|nr:CRISPR-associated helicase/endonuclease Cas3 [Gallaecimonas xiamenensis]EKE71704.1 CRISPR-associated helicase Cas3 [Gallaecimonas xiamenensis 3-C-1]
MSDAIYRYWGKARKDDNLQGDAYHLLPYHSLDVAAVGWWLLSERFGYGAMLAKKLALPQAQLQRLFAFFLSVHDLGKFARAFQNLAPDLSDKLVPSLDAYRYTERHDSLGFWLFKQSEVIKSQLADRCCLPARKIASSGTLDCWLQIVTGHHGQPPKAQLKRPEHFFTADDMAAAEAFFMAMLDLWLQPEDLPLLVDRALKAALIQSSWQLAGLAVLADWQGSNQIYFPYQKTPQALGAYWQERAKPQALKALQQAGIEGIAAAPFTSIKRLFPFIETPTPLQQYAIEQPLSDGPQLFILEDVTGAGKTEAALTLVHRLLAQGSAGGLYIGLPTMATANAMYQRLAECYGRLFTDEARPSLVLSHGARHLSETFRQSVMLPEQPVDLAYQAEEASASVYCNEWLADSRKKALLATVGVGTLDQALLSVLPARHQSLRLLGLVGKVLLVDEVHAYDPYMRTLLARLLTLHARQGGSAILLSATLPQTMKSELLEAFAKGLAQLAPCLTASNYPLATQFPAPNGESERPLATRPEVQRTVRLERLDDEAAALALIEQSVSQGRCVCWVRNTVDEARKAYAALASKGLNQQQLTLFHSRFAMQDRQRIEQQILSLFGKQGDGSQRRGQVLVATQVVEQSLDLDFDVMISDLAPVDLLLQRAGRLHRHTRNVAGAPMKGRDERATPVFYLLSPSPTTNADDSWLPKGNGSRAVYQNLALLWRSAVVLLEKGHFCMPEDARFLIEQVYSPDTPLQAPDALLDSAYELEGQHKAAVSIANANVLNLDQGYSQSSNATGWGEEVNIPTRLSDNTVSVVLLAQDGQGHWHPYAKGTDFPWDLSQLSLRERQWQQAEQTLDQATREQLQRLKDNIPALKWQQLFPLSGPWQAFYSAEQGWLGEQGEKR